MQSRDGEYNLFEHAQGDGAGRVTLSEAAAAAGHVLDDCQAELDAIRRTGEHGPARTGMDRRRNRA